MTATRVEKLILMIATVMIFLNLTIYLPFAGLFPFPAYLLDLMIFILVISYYIFKGITIPYNNVIIFWLLYYTIINIVYFLISPAGPDEFRFIKLFFFFFFMIFSLILLFNLDDNDLSVTRKTLVFLVPVTTFMLGVDYFNPGYFYFGKETTTFVMGRAAATYLNANLAAGAMVLFLILGIDMIPKKYRIIFILLVFMGIFFTMSRSNIMIMFIILMIMFFQKKLYGSHLLITFTVIITFFIWLATGGLDVLSENYDLKVTENMKSRVDFFADNKESDTGDMDERKYILKEAFEMFQSNPIFGAGYSSTRLWNHRVSPHNTFIMNWADYGLFGILIIPLLIYLSCYYIFRFGKKEYKHMAILISIYFIFSSFFSHNMLETPFQLASMILLSSLGLKAKRENEKVIK